MLLSMTGYGEARHQSDNLNLAIELRSVNNRYLKLVLRAGEPYNLLEAEFEKVIRRTIKRGTIQVHMQCQRQYAPQDFVINSVALRSFDSHSFTSSIRTFGSVVQLMSCSSGRSRPCTTCVQVRMKFEWSM